MNLSAVSAAFRVEAGLPPGFRRVRGMTGSQKCPGSRHMACSLRRTSCSAASPTALTVRPVSSATAKRRRASSGVSRNSTRTGHSVEMARSRGRPRRALMGCLATISSSGTPTSAKLGQRVIARCLPGGVVRSVRATFGLSEIRCGLPVCEHTGMCSRWEVPTRPVGQAAPPTRSRLLRTPQGRRIGPRRSRGR